MALTYVQADDGLISRRRDRRAALFFSTAALTPIVGAILGGTLSSTFIDLPIATSIGTVLGGLGGWMLFLNTKHRFIVQNDTTGALVTLDALRSLFKLGKVDVIYGPGTHFAYPWEQRFEGNNIPVIEATEDFKFPVQCEDGILLAEGSFRLRPDFRNPVAFLSGVASVAGDLKDLIIVKAASHYKNKKVTDATSSLPELNQLLDDTFVQGQKDSGLEIRFGVQIGDVTIRTVLPSEELQRTLSALAEAEMIFLGTAKVLGRTKDELKAGLEDGSVTKEEFDHARREFRIISGNMDNAEVKRWEVDVTGISPEIVQAATAFLSRVPPETLKQFASGGKKPSARNTPKGGGRK
jgi:hypothetical protein